jgi:translation initiation factor 1 (eIF-1/SUI1)
MTNPDDPTSPSRKKKPVRLNIEVGLLESASPQGALSIKDSSKGGTKDSSKQSSPKVQAASNAKAPSPGFDGRMRFEKKGRGGQPVIVLYALGSGACAKALAADLESFARRLRQTLGCGGTVDGSEVILQLRDRERLEATLTKWGIKLQASGGF